MAPGDWTWGPAAGLRPRWAGLGPRRLGLGLPQKRVDSAPRLPYNAKRPDVEYERLSVVAITMSHTPLPSAFDTAIKSLQKCGFVKSANYINYLRSTDDLEEGDQPLTAESVMGFAELMYRFRDLGEPMLGIFSEGTLSVEWRIADDKHLLIEPLDDKNASFAFISPTNKSGEKFRVNGRGAIEEVIDTLRSHGVDGWKKK